MGLPEFIINFNHKAETAVKSPARGIVAVILADDTKTNKTYTVSKLSEIDKTHFTDENYGFIEMIFKGAPKRVIVERIATSDSYDDVLARLKNKKWDWLTVPCSESPADIAAWIKAQRSTNKKTFKAVLPKGSTGYNSPYIVEFATDDIVCGETTYSTAEFCPRIAGILAGTELNTSIIYYTIPEITSITESTTPDEDINSGKLIIINDDEKFKIARGVNSLATLSDGQTAEFKKIKIIEGMDFIVDEIRDVFINSYMGTSNSYDNKMLFVSAINDYLKTLANSYVLDPEGTNHVEIDVEAQRKYLSEQGKDIENMTDDEVKHSKTDSYIFLCGSLSFLDAIEDLKIEINM